MYFKKTRETRKENLPPPPPPTVGRLSTDGQQTANLFRIQKLMFAAFRTAVNILECLRILVSGNGDEMITIDCAEVTFPFSQNYFASNLSSVNFVQHFIAREIPC